MKKIAEVLALARRVNAAVRGQIGLQPHEEALRKLLTEDSQKPGELAEILKVLGGARWEAADELADVAYYAVQLGGEWIGKLSQLAGFLGFTLEEALDAAFIKYECRTRVGKDKPREQAAIRAWIKTIPDRPIDRKRAEAFVRKILSSVKNSPCA